jgi:chromosome segregation ATPase
LSDEIAKIESESRRLDAIEAKYESRKQKIKSYLAGNLQLREELRTLQNLKPERAQTIAKLESEVRERSLAVCKAESPSTTPAQRAEIDALRSERKALQNSLIDVDRRIIEYHAQLERDLVDIRQSYAAGNTTRQRQIRETEAQLGRLGNETDRLQALVDKLEKEVQGATALLQAIGKEGHALRMELWTAESRVALERKFAVKHMFTELPQNLARVRDQQREIAQLLRENRKRARRMRGSATAKGRRRSFKTRTFTLGRSRVFRYY